VADAAKVHHVLDSHEAYTVIRYSDDDSTVGYECQCGAKDPDSELWGRAWLNEHLTQEIMKIL
jgi:hypothetical protein